MGNKLELLKLTLRNLESRSSRLLLAQKLSLVHTLRKDIAATHAADSEPYRSDGERFRRCSRGQIK